MSRILAAAVLLPALVLLAAPAVPAYVYPGGNGLQPIAVMEPTADGVLLRTWAPSRPDAPGWGVGASVDALRYRLDTDDQDVILSVTGSYSSPRFRAGLTLPYIVRDPDFNESDLLDLRAFARMGLMDRKGFLLDGELSLVLPTAAEGDLYPFTLDSTLAALRVAGAWSAAPAVYGFNLGYQSYLESETGSDSDLLYGAFARWDVRGAWAVAAELSGSRHAHSGSPGDETVGDDYVAVVLQHRTHGGIRTSAGVASGLGDSAADARFAANVLVPLGGKGKARPAARPAAPPTRLPAAAPAAKPAEPPASAPAVQPAAAPRPTAAPAPPAAKPLAPAVPSTPPKAVAPPAKAASPRVGMRIVDGSGVKGLGRKVGAALESTGSPPAEVVTVSPRAGAKTVLRYPAGAVEEALRLSRLLTRGKVLADVRLVEDRSLPAAGPMVLELGADQKK